MPHSLLGRVTLGYEPVWGPQRQRIAMRLWLEPEAHAGVQAPQLLATLGALWPLRAGPLLLSIRSEALLDALLEQPPVPGLWLEMQEHQLADARRAATVRHAHARGLPLVWRGGPGQAPSAATRPCFHSTLRSLTPQEALAALRAARTTAPGEPHPPSPVQAASLYEGLPSAALVSHALDQQGAQGVLGWPTDDVLHGYRFRQIQPARAVILALLHAIDADASLDHLTQRLGEEPLLSYRFLRYANSAGLGLPGEVGSVRQGLLAIGFAPLRSWLLAQLPQASTDPNLKPIRDQMVLRARTMEQLADAGVESELRREAFLCGIFSQLDLLLGEPLGHAMHHLPLPGRVASAIVGQTGPYAAWLEVATALESGSTRLVREVCRAHQMAPADVNRALLRTLAAP